MSRFVFCGICDTNLGVFFERDAEDDAPGLDSCRTTIVGTSPVSNSWRISRRFTRESRRFPFRSRGRSGALLAAKPSRQRRTGMCQRPSIMVAARRASSFAPSSLGCSGGSSNRQYRPIKSTCSAVVL
jgi:hypothetical protein